MAMESLCALFLLADAYLIIMQVSCTRLCVLTACLLYLFGLHKANDGLHRIHSLLCQPSQPSLQPIPSHLCLPNLPYLVTWCLLNLLYIYLVFQAVWSSTLIWCVYLVSYTYICSLICLPSVLCMHAHAVVYVVQSSTTAQSALPMQSVMSTCLIQSACLLCCLSVLLPCLVCTACLLSLLCLPRRGMTQYKHQ